MIPRTDSWLGRIVAACAVMLMALLVVQAPVSTADHMLHAAGQAHAANAFADALLDPSEHDHVSTISADDDQAASTDQAVSDQTPDDATSPGSHHHHHDGPSVLASGLNLPIAWSSQVAAFKLDDDLRNGVSGFPQERPPKPDLEHTA